jgi:hypothetical protein
LELIEQWTAGDFTGAAYIFAYDDNAGGFKYVQKLTSSSSSDLDQFGFSVSIKEKYVVAGAPQNDQFGTNAGAAYVFQKGGSSDDDFVPVYDLASPDPAPSALFGWSVSVNSKGVIAVGAKGDRTAKGSVYIFKPAGSGWTHVFTLEPNVTASFFNVGNAGWDVAIDDL